MKNLYIDVGSTNIKYSTDGENIFSRPFPPAVVDDGVRYEVDINSVVDVLKEIMDGEAETENVYFSVQMHGYVLSDERHIPLTPYISWRDKRFLLLKEKYPFLIKSEYGTAAKDNLPAFGVYAQSKLFSDFGKARYFDTLGSYVVYALTGACAVHITDACPSGFYTLSGGLNAIAESEAFGNLIFPSVKEAVGVCGRYGNKEIYIPVGDQQASVLGTELGEDECLVNTGTAAQLCLLADGSASGNFESRPYFGGRTLCTVTGLFGGADGSARTEEELEKSYLAAAKRLPRKRRLVAIGGFAEHNAELFERIGRKRFSDYELRKNAGAIKGLMKLANIKEAGMMLSEIPFSNMPVILKASGFDFFIIDCEHGGFDYVDVSKIIMTAKLSHLKCIVRLADNTRKDVIKFMDMGADGVLLRMTDCAEDIGKAVEYAKYAPIGRRGISTMRAHTLYNPSDLSEYMRSANSRTEVYAQIETVAGMKNLEEIVSVEGVSGCIVGPNDLSCEYGCLGNGNAPEILAAIERVSSVCKAAGKKSGIITGNGHYLKKAGECGMEIYCVGSELNMIKDSACRTVEMIRAL